MNAAAPTAPPPLYEAGQGSTVVLLHGATATWRAWLPVLPHLEPHHRVWAPTMAGHHGGPAIDCAPADVVPTIVDDLERRMDAAGIERAHLVGNSLGGWAALELARRRRATSVVALSPAGAWDLPADLDALLRLFKVGARVGSWRVIHRAVRIGWVRRIVMRSVCEHAERMSAATATAMFDDMVGCAALSAMISGARDAGPMPPFEREVDCRVRLAWSGSDRTLPFERYGRPMAAAVPQAELVTLPGVGHVPMYDDPTLVARTVLEVTTAVDSSDTTTYRKDPT